MAWRSVVLWIMGDPVGLHLIPGLFTRVEEGLEGSGFSGVILNALGVLFFLVNLERE